MFLIRNLRVLFSRGMNTESNSQSIKLPRLTVRFVADWEYSSPRVFAGDEVTIPAVVVRRRKNKKKGR